MEAGTVEKLQDFPLDQVQITDTYQQNLFTKDVTYLLTTLDSDRLMAGFLAVSQAVNPTNLYGGWEDSNIRGHTMGHWLSAVAHAYLQAVGSDATLAAQIKTKLDDVISKLKSYQLSSGFLFATPMSQFDDFDNGTGSTWVPYYTLHKILAGLIDVYEFENNPDALTVASKPGDWLYTRASGWSASQKSRVLSQEYGGSTMPYPRRWRQCVVGLVDLLVRVHGRWGARRGRLAGDRTAGWGVVLRRRRGSRANQLTQ
jgi:hypothetical protein